jgi:hypothetical protein
MATQKEISMSDQNPPTYPVTNGAAAGNAAPTAPPEVTIAFWLYIATAAINLFSLIVALVSLGSSRAEIQRQITVQGIQLSGSGLNAILAIAITVLVIVGIVSVAAYVVFPYFMRRGANWARIVLLIITALSVFGILGSYGLGAARFVVPAIATLLIFLKPANEYFRAVTASKVR